MFTSVAAFTLKTDVNDLQCVPWSPLDQSARGPVPMMDRSFSWDDGPSLSEHHKVYDSVLSDDCNSICSRNSDLSTGTLPGSTRPFMWLTASLTFCSRPLSVHRGRHKRRLISTRPTFGVLLSPWEQPTDHTECVNAYTGDKYCSDAPLLM